MMLGDESFIGAGNLGGGLQTSEASLSPAAFLPDPAATSFIPTIRADIWGGISIPAQLPTLGNVGPLQTMKSMTSAGDPALMSLLSFLYAFLVTDKNITVLWNATGCAPGYPAIKTVQPYNPSDKAGDGRGLGLNVDDLPALHIWRADGESRFEQMAEDVRLDISQLKLLWIFPLAMQEVQRVRNAFLNAMAKAIDASFERGRTPSWVVPGDPDPSAKYFGSLLYPMGTTPIYPQMNIAWLHGVSWRQVRVIIGDTEGYFPALEMTIELAENKTKDPTIATFPNALALTLSNGTDITNTYNG